MKQQLIFLVNNDFFIENVFDDEKDDFETKINVLDSDSHIYFDPDKYSVDEAKKMLLTHTIFYMQNKINDLQYSINRLEELYEQ